jgi:rhodanese-related sulfurtransferase
LSRGLEARGGPTQKRMREERHLSEPRAQQPAVGEDCPHCPIASCVSLLVRTATTRFPHALRAAGLLCIVAVAALVWNARLPLGLPWLPSPGGRVGIPRAFESKLPEISAAQALKLYQAGGALFVDSRDRKDYEVNHIPGAVNAPMREWSKIWPGVRAALPNDRTLVLYCYGEHCGLSTRQGKALLQQGYSKLVVIDYGWKTWTDHGYPQTKRAEGKK